MPLGAEDPRVPPPSGSPSPGRAPPCGTSIPEPVLPLAFGPRQEERSAEQSGSRENGKPRSGGRRDRPHRRADGHTERRRPPRPGLPLGRGPCRGLCLGLGRGQIWAQPTTYCRGLRFPQKASRGHFGCPRRLGRPSEPAGRACGGGRELGLAKVRTLPPLPPCWAALGPGPRLCAPRLHVARVLPRKTSGTVSSLQNTQDCFRGKIMPGG